MTPMQQRLCPVRAERCRRGNVTKLLQMSQNFTLCPTYINVSTCRHNSARQVGWGVTLHALCLWASTSSQLYNGRRTRHCELPYTTHPMRFCSLAALRKSRCPGVRCSQV